MPHLIYLAQTDASGSGLGSILFLVVMVGVFWLLFIRPQRRRMREQQEIQSALKSGDVVQTIGGIRGRVVAVDDDSVVIELESGRMRIARKAIAARLES